MVGEVAQAAEGDAKLRGLHLGGSGGAGHGATRMVLRASDVLWRPRVLSRFTLFGTSVAGTGSASSSRSSGQAGDGMAVATGREGSMLLWHAALHADPSFARFYVVAVRTNLSFREPQCATLRTRRSPHDVHPLCKTDTGRDGLPQGEGGCMSGMPARTLSTHPQCAWPWAVEAAVRTLHGKKDGHAQRRVRAQRNRPARRCLLDMEACTT
jgi:hypothetical protein